MAGLSGRKNKKMNEKTDIRWLVVGAIAGLFAAGYGILRQASTGGELPDSAIANVNETLISRDNFARAAARVTASQAEVSAEDKVRLLQRLIDDELLVQRGVELGMTESDTEVRAAIVNSLIASITAEADSASPTDAELEQYLADHADRFSYTSRVHVEVWQTDNESLAQDAANALRASEPVPASDDLRAMPDLPPGLVPAEVLRDYLGPAITAAAADMPDGSSSVFARRGRWLVVQVVAKERAVVTDLDTIRNRVLLDYRRNLADDMLESYLENLRQRADITVTTP
jgi:hypothetical protein